MSFDLNNTLPPVDGITTTGSWACSWVGYLIPTVSGDHDLRFTYDDGINVTFDETLIYNHFNDGGETSATLSLGSLTSGSLHPIKIDYTQALPWAAILRMNVVDPSMGGVASVLGSASGPRIKNDDTSDSPKYTTVTECTQVALYSDSYTGYFEFYWTECNGAESETGAGSTYQATHIKIADVCVRDGTLDIVNGTAEYGSACS